MEKLRNKKILTIIVLVIAIVGLSVGFAAFSSVLTISSEAQVNPDASTFSVKFSKVSDSVLDGEDNPVNPISGNGSNGIINNGKNPTLTGLKASFQAPGESVVYKFYVRNEGEYLAYLNSIEIGSKGCTPGTGADPTLVGNACEDINVSVKVGSMNEVTSTQENITGQTLAANSYQEVIVTIAYAENGARADGPFSVKLGDIYLTYSSIQDFEFVPNGSYACTLATETMTTEDNYGTDIILGTAEVVTCGSEQFYVMERNSSTITMLTKYNLSTTESPYLQSETNAGKTQFYLVEEATSEVLPPSNTYIYDNPEYPNLITSYVETYKNYLIDTLGVSVLSAKLMSLEQANSIGVSWEGCSIGKEWACTTEYWLGTSHNMSFCDGTVCAENIYFVGDIIDRGVNTLNSTSMMSKLGIRPVITITTDQVQM